MLWPQPNTVPVIIVSRVPRATSVPGRSAAPGGKLTQTQWEAICREGAQAKAAAKLSARQVARIVKGDSWSQGWVPPRFENDVKLCKVCGKEFMRRFKCGRLRNDGVWERKRTCGSSCANRLAWREGHFKNRGKR